jgi:hypothetical protein
MTNHNTSDQIPSTDAIAMAAAMQHIGGIVFRKDMEYGSKEVEESIQQSSAEYIHSRDESAKITVRKMNALLQRSLDIAPERANFTCTFDTPEDWFLYRRYFSVIKPMNNVLDRRGDGNYGIIVNFHNHRDEGRRKNFPVAILAQTEVIKDGELYYDTIAVVDRSSGCFYEKWRTEEIPEDNCIETEDFFSRNKIAHRFNTNVHLVRFLTQERMYTDTFSNSDISEEEIDVAYNPANKQFSFSSDDFKMRHPSSGVYNIRKIEALHPATIKQFPELLESLAGFVTVCPCNDEEKTEQYLNEIAKEIEKFKDDPYFE